MAKKKKKKKKEFSSERVKSCLLHSSKQNTAVSNL